LTQEQVAEFLGVSRQAVSKWEAGKGYPETEKIMLLADKLEVSLDYLMLDKKENINHVEQYQSHTTIIITDRKSLLSLMMEKALVHTINLK